MRTKVKTYYDTKNYVQNIIQIPYVTQYSTFIVIDFCIRFFYM